MDKSGYSKPLIGSGWLRALLYIIALFLLVIIFLSFFILGLYNGKFDATTLQSVFKKENLGILNVILFILTVVITFVVRRWVDRKSFISLGLDFNGHVWEAIEGGMLAVFIISGSSLLLNATGHLKWMEIIFDPKALFLSFGSIVLIAFYEELIFRGYILNNLMDSFPKWLALLISAILFMIFHWTSSGFFPLFNMLIMGLILGLNYIYTRNLWFSICFHVGWKFMVGPVLGFSGDETFQTLLQTEMKGDENITGGTSGLEGSVLLMAVSLISLIALYIFLQKKLNPVSQPAPGRI
jgi:membrane protease YdiL (CAAX protease family)